MRYVSACVSCVHEAKCKNKEIWCGRYKNKYAAEQGAKDLKEEQDGKKG